MVKDNVFSLRSRPRQDVCSCHFYSVLYWTEQLGKEKKQKASHWKGKVELSLFANDNILYTEKRREYIHTRTHTHTHMHTHTQ